MAFKASFWQATLNNCRQNCHPKSTQFHDIILHNCAALATELPVPIAVNKWELHVKKRTGFQLQVHSCHLDFFTLVAIIFPTYGWPLSTRGYFHVRSGERINQWHQSCLRDTQLGAPLMSPLGCPWKWYPFFFGQLPSFKLLGRQELEWVTGAHPVTWQQLGFECKLADCQIDVLTMWAAVLLLAQIVKIYDNFM